MGHDARAPAAAAVLAGVALLVGELARPGLAAPPQEAPRPEASPDDPPGPPPLYEQLRRATLEPAGRIRDGLLRVDRFELALTDGDLFLLEPVGGRITGAVFLGRGRVRAYPPDAVEHQQLRKHLDADLLEESFDRLVLRFSDDTADRLRALAEPSTRSGNDLRKASSTYEDRRDRLFKDQLINPDSRILADLVDGDAEGPAEAGPYGTYVLALVGGTKRDWFAIEIEPRNLEEVGVWRYDRGHEMSDVWMGAHALTDFEAGSIRDPFAGFPIDPASLDRKSDEIVGADLGLPVRPLEPARDRWSPLADTPVITADVSLGEDGRTRGTAALLVEPMRAMRTIRLRISPFLEVTDVRWRMPGPAEAGPYTNDDAEAAVGAAFRRPGSIDLLAGRPAGERASDPVSVSGEPLHATQAKRPRFMADDLFEPWVTVTLPRQVAPAERFILELAYEGKVVEKLRTSGDFLLRDTLYWIPRQPDSRRSRFHLTFRVPSRYGVASPGDVLDDRVEEDTRIVRRATDRPINHVSFHYGRFDVTAVELDGVPPITVYANAGAPGFAPGQREKTIDDLAGAIRTQSDYFGPYPFASLQVTETPMLSGQAFAGFLLLSFQSFGELYTGEAELFRSHEVAHQWWGAGVEWEHYRDQWLSEGFAQYGAALYVRSGLGEPRQFAEMLAAWRRDVLGEPSIGQGRGLAHYGFRPSVIRESQGSESGPLVAGFRLRSTKTPFDYRLIAYEKGALVLHMLRVMLTDLHADDDQRFRVLMQRFASRHMFATATTRDFETAVAEAFGEPMDWFFDQWVYGTEIPTYRPDLRVSPLVDSDAPFVLHGSIAQEDVPDGFKMPVPIALHFPDDDSLIVRLWIDRDTVPVELPLPARPSSIEFNYGDAVLARVK